MADGGIGEMALLSEIAPEAIGAGMGAADAGIASSLGLLGSGTSVLPSAMTMAGADVGLGAGLNSIVAPEAAAQNLAAIQSAAPGANQIASTLGTNQGIGATVTPQVAPQATQMIETGVDTTPYQLTQTPTPNLPSAMTMEGANAAAPSSGGLRDLFDKFTSLPIEKQMLYGGAASMAANALFGNKQGNPAAEKYSGPLSRFHYNPDVYVPTTTPQPTPYQAQYTNYRGYAGGGPVEQMANANAIGQNTGYPQSALHQGAYATPWQTPISQNVLSGAADTNVDPYTGEERLAKGGIAALGAYSDGGQMLKGPGDGMSDDIPATIAGKQPARLANDEFVVPADVVSHLGNGSSDAGAKQLYKMMDRVRQARTGKKAQGKEIKPDKYMPA